MKHIKNFLSLNENEAIMASPGVFYAERWVKSSSEDADYDVTWKDSAGNIITASFIDTGDPIVQDNSGVGYSTFESILSTDGLYYTGTVSYREAEDGSFEIMSIKIEPK